MEKHIDALLMKAHSKPQGYSLTFLTAVPVKITVN
jgi:hypothetical protein